MLMEASKDARTLGALQNAKTAPAIFGTDDSHDAPAAQ